MLWIKFVLGGLIIAFCTFLGWLAAGKYRLRKSFFAQFNGLNEKYLAELKFSRKPLAQFLQESKFSGDFGKMIDSHAKTRSADVGFSYLLQSEKEFLGEYLSMLGKGDSSSQSGYFSAQKDFLAEKKAECEKQAKERNELYLKLGLLAGLAFVILIV